MVSFIGVDEFTAGDVKNFKALLALLKSQPAKPVGYQVRYWSHADKRWVTDYLIFTNKKGAMAFQKTFAPSEKATIIATLRNGQRVFISGTKR